MTPRNPLRRFRRLPCLLAAALLAEALPGETLYETGFENFTAGTGTWAGTDGWVLSKSSSISSATNCHGIDSNLVPGLGKTAALGFRAPTFSTLISGTNFVRVGRKVAADPVAAGKPIVSFYCLMGLTASTSGGKDDFELLVYNQADTMVLGGLTFDLSDGYIYRTDGVGFTNTGIPVDYDTVLEVNMRINYLTNRWSATVGGVSVVNGAVFTNRSTTKDFGSVQARWYIGSPSAPGNNWMLLDDWTMSAAAEAKPTFDSIGHVGTSTVLKWYGEVGYNYTVQAKNDLTSATWTTLTATPLTTTSSRGLMSYTDSSASYAGMKYYRLVRVLP